MIFPDDARKWVGTFVVLDWDAAIIPGRPKTRTHSGGRVLRVDETYLYLQPFSLAPAQPRAVGSRPGVTRLGLQAREEQIPLVDIDTIYPTPMEDVEIVE